MLIGWILEAIAIVVVGALAVTQILLPIALGRPLFPALRRRTLARQLREAREALDESAMAEDLSRLRPPSSPPSPPPASPPSTEEHPE